MSVILLIVGIVVTGAGLAALGFGIPINEFSLGTTLITAGTTGLCSGLILIGLSAAVAELRRVGDLLKARPARPACAQDRGPGSGRAGRPATGGSGDANRHFAGRSSPGSAALYASARSGRLCAGPEHAGECACTGRSRWRSPRASSAAAAETRDAAARSASRGAATGARLLDGRFRRGDRALALEHPAHRTRAAGTRDGPGRRGSSVIPKRRPSGAGAPGQPRTGARTAAHAGRPSGWRRRRGTEVIAVGFSVPRPASDPAAGGELRSGAAGRDAIRPGCATGNAAANAAAISRNNASARAPPPAPPPPAASHPAPPTVDTRPHEPAPAAEQPAGILKSGVVDGMAYTLYSDGSIEAKLPDGTVRFGSIAELRAHIEKHP